MTDSFGTRKLYAIYENGSRLPFVVEPLRIKRPQVFDFQDGNPRGIVFDELMEMTIKNGKLYFLGSEKLHAKYYSHANLLTVTHNDIEWRFFNQPSGSISLTGCYKPHRPTSPFNLFFGMEKVSGQEVAYDLSQALSNLGVTEFNMSEFAIALTLPSEKLTLFRETKRTLIPAGFVD